MSKIKGFSAAWCPNCPTIKPVWAKLEEDGYDVEIVDVEASPNVANNWGVKSLPTTIIVDDQDEELKRIVGARPYSFMLEQLKD